MRFLENLLKWGVVRWSDGVARVIYNQGADTVGVAGTASQKMAEVLLPAGSLRVGDTIRVTIAWVKSGTSDTLTMPMYIGPLGTSADQLQHSPQAMSAAATSYGGMFAFKVTSDTTIRLAGAPGSSGSLVGTSGALPSDKTVASVSSTPNRFSLYATMSGSADIPTLRSLIVERIPGVN